MLTASRRTIQPDGLIRGKKTWWRNGLLAAAGGLAYLKVWVPLTGLSIPCPIHLVTGLYCPGCGMTRALMSLLELDLYQALRYNAMLFAVPPLLAAYAWFRHRGTKGASSILMGFLLVLVLAYGLARNIPVWSWLEPTELGPLP